jgi:hypothetical protein
MQAGFDQPAFGLPGITPAASAAYAGDFNNDVI